MNLNEEIREGYTVSETMKRVWAIQMEMAKHVLNVCKRHNLQIWADGGTLLGTIRHKGFIPWDDDIDMLMPRRDYDTLISIAKEEFKSPYFLQCAYTDKEYYRGHIQIRYDNTTAILADEIDREYNLGIFLDIFCYDSYPDKEDELWKKRLVRADEIEKMLNYRYIKLFPYIFIHPNYYFKILINKIKTTIKGPLNLYKEYEDLFRIYDSMNTSRISSQSFNRKITDRSMKEKKWFKETIWLPFEDMLMPVPVDYDKWLTRLYGANYMTPQKAPSFHGGYLVIDPNKSYKAYLPILKKKKKKIIIEKILKKINVSNKILTRLWQEFDPYQ